MVLGLTHRALLWVVDWMLQSAASKLLMKVVKRVQLEAFDLCLHPEVKPCLMETQVEQWRLRQALLFKDADL